MTSEEFRQGAVEYAKTHHGVLPKMGFVSSADFLTLARDRHATVVIVADIPIYEMPHLTDDDGVVFVGQWWGWKPVREVSVA